MLKIEEFCLSSNNVLVGEKINISARVIDISWDNIKTKNRDWENIKDKYKTWFSVRIDSKK